MATVRNCGVLNKQLVINYNGGGLDTLVKNTHGAVIINNKGANIGNAKGLNQALKYGIDNYENITHIAVIADDIVMPLNWGEIAINSDNQHGWGLIGFHCVQDIGVEIKPNIYQPHRVFGCWVFNKKWFDKAGYFLDNLSKYGKWDAEYNRRLLHHGAVNVYIGKSHHNGLDNEPREYREFKNQELRKANANMPKKQTIHYDPFRK